jgi:Ragulator complex protein LAMTOR5
MRRELLLFKQAKTSTSQISSKILKVVENLNVPQNRSAHIYFTSFSPYTTLPSLAFILPLFSTQPMNQSIDAILAAKPNIRGFICIDSSNGLCLNSKKELLSSYDGHINQLYTLASQLNNEDNSTTPIIVIEMESKDILVKEYGSMVIGVSCTKN